MRKTLAALLCSLFMVSMTAHAVQTLKWDKTPIRINLMVGVEQMIHFPVHGQLGLTPSLAQEGLFSALFANKTAYWTALQPFESQRIKVRLESGEYILFDVSASTEEVPPQTLEPLNIVIADNNDTTLAAIDSNEDKATIFDLIRYAAQMTYSPARLIEPLMGVREVSIETSRNLNALYNHQNHQGLIIVPIKSWSADTLYVTALGVINTHSHQVVLDNRLIQHTHNANIHGVDHHFIASSFYRNSLSKGGEEGDRTTLFIVTDQPLMSVLRLGVNQ